MNFNVLILGSNSAIPTANKFPSSQLITVNHKYYLIDCGEGTQMQLRRYSAKFQRIEHIFISHLHGDHFFGLIGLLMTMQLLGRDKPLTIFAHEGLQEVIELQLKLSGGQFSFPLSFYTIKRGETGVLLNDGNVEVHTFPLDHRIACNGFLFKEVERPRHILKDRADEYEISISQFQNLKLGLDVENVNGELIKNELVTSAPDKVRSFAYCSDTGYNESIVQHISGCDLLYHEATFGDDMIKRAKETRHSTARQAATIAQLAKVKKLLIGHFSVRYESPAQLLKEALEVFENTVVAKEGDIYHVIS